MDNKLTKKRLSNFLAYEWILIIVVSVAVIFAWELVYTMAGVRLTVGQEFSYYFDEDISAVGSDLLANSLTESNVFSYDVKNISSESLSSSYNVLTTRLSVYEGDIIFTDSAETEGENVRAKELIDNYCYSYDELLADAKKYIAQFYTDGTLDESKIISHFNERKSKRVYKNAIKAGEISDADEVERIKKLKKDITDFEKVLNSDVENLFYRYTRFEQSYETAGDSSKASYQTRVEQEKEADRENAIYGINMSALHGGEINITSYMKLSGTDSAENIVMLVFDFTSEQPDLQYETISFINHIVRKCSDILS